MQNDTENMLSVTCIGCSEKRTSKPTSSSSDIPVLSVSQSMDENDTMCEINDLLLPVSQSSFTVSVPGGICHISFGKRKTEECRLLL